MIVSEELEEEKPPLSEQDPLLLGFNQLSPNYSCTRVRSHVQDCAITQPVSSSSRTLRRRYLRTWGLVVAFALFAFAIYDSSFGDDSVVDWPDWPDWMSHSDEISSHRPTKPGCYNLNTNSSSRFQQIIYAPNGHTQHPPVTSPTFRNSHSFRLPVTADLLYFESNDSQIRGSLQFVTDDSISANFVKVDVVVSYHTQTALDCAQLCYMVEGRRQHGLGIYTKTDASSTTSEQLLFDVVIRLPRPAKTAPPCNVGAIRVDVSNFAITTGDLQHEIDVQSVQMSTSNADISVKSLRAENAFLSTSNGKISGTFNITDSLGLMTSNAAINATISMANTDKEPASQLYMSTSNAPISTTLHLHTSHHPLFPPAFIASAHTTNGELSIRIPTQPEDATVFVRGTTSNARAEVAVSGTFVGTFALGTSLATPVVVRGEGPDDAVDTGRDDEDRDEAERRRVDVRKLGWGAVEGAVWKGPISDDESGTGRRRKSSSVALQTSLMPVVLRLL